MTNPLYAFVEVVITVFFVSVYELPALRLEKDREVLSMEKERLGWII